MKQRQAFLDQIEQQLLQKRDEVMTQLHAQEEEIDFSGQVKDIGDEALQTSLDKLQNSLQKSEIDEIHLIEEALARIKKGEYGVCVDCNSDISNQRLTSYPYAARCIVCQEALEG